MKRWMFALFLAFITTAAVQADVGVRTDPTHEATEESGRVDADPEGRLILSLKSTHSDRLAGIYFARPDVLVVRLTGDNAVASPADIEGEGPTVVFQTGAKHTLSQLRQAFDGHVEEIRAIVPRSGGYIDERRGAVVVVLPHDMPEGFAKQAELEKCLACLCGSSLGRPLLKAIKPM